MRARTWIPVTLLVAAGVAIALAVLLMQRTVDAADVRPVTEPVALERQGTQAMRLVTFDPARVGYTVTFAPGREGVRAQTDRSERAVTVFLRDGDAPHVVAHDIAHELGHAFDHTRMDGAGRQAFLASRGVPDAPWNPSGESDYASGAGDFAEVFALCFAASPDFRSELAPRPENPCELLPVEAL